MKRCWRGRCVVGVMVNEMVWEGFGKREMMSCVQFSEMLENRVNLGVVYQILWVGEVVIKIL